MEALRNNSRLLLLAAAVLATLAGLVLVELNGGAIASGAPVATKGGKRAKPGKLKLVNDSTLRMSEPNESPRAVVMCGKLEPYGGGMSAIPAPDRQGEGVYPHSYERLGDQLGFHTTPVLFDPTPKGAGAVAAPQTTRTYSVTLQVLCARKFGKIADPHDIALNVPSGTSVTLNANCPNRSVLIGGGFQRMAYEVAGGVYPTESHAISSTEWQASGTAFGTIKNDAVSIAYCMASPKRKPLLQETTASVAIAPQTVGSVTTPPCPGRTALINNGFDTNPKNTTGPAGLFFSNGIIGADQTFTASAYNNGATAATLTAYGYCMKKTVIGGSLLKFTKKLGSLDKSTVTKEDQDGNPNG